MFIESALRMFCRKFLKVSKCCKTQGWDHPVYIVQYLTFMLFSTWNLIWDTTVCSAWPLHNLNEIIICSIVLEKLEAPPLPITAISASALMARKLETYINHSSAKIVSGSSTFSTVVRRYQTISRTKHLEAGIGIKKVVLRISGDNSEEYLCLEISKTAFWIMF